VRDENDFYWRPQLCFDGFCVNAGAAPRTVWDGFRIYYPKKNQVISARWKSFAVSDSFRLRERPF
jgi:hypothetical protein